MLKYFYSLALTLFSSIIFAQSYSNKTGVRIVYDYTDNFVNTKEVLFANSKSAVYTINPKDDSWDGKRLQSVVSPTKNGMIFRKPEQVEIYLSSENDLVTLNTITNDAKRRIVNDTTISFNWKLYPEDGKIIAGYNCLKAGLSWRGRNYTAYYTTEIPLPFGPYKFKGLPGLILSLQTTTNGELYSWKASSIEAPYKIKTSIPLIADDLKGKRINMFQFIEIADKLILEEINIQRARLDKTKLLVKVEVERHTVEKFYEWEKGGLSKKEYFKERDIKY